MVRTRHRGGADHDRALDLDLPSRTPGAAAWRAVSQVGTSWLSREGVAALVTYLPIAALGLGWVFGEYEPGQIIVGAALSIVCALVTGGAPGASTRRCRPSAPGISAWSRRSI